MLYLQERHKTWNTLVTEERLLSEDWLALSCTANTRQPVASKLYKYDIL